MSVSKYKPYPKYYSCNQEWIKQYPSHWEKMQLSRVIELIADGGTPPRSNSLNFGGGIPWVTVKDISDGIRKTEENLTEIGFDNCSTRLWKVGDVILCITASIGKVGVARVPLSTKQGIVGIRPAEKILSEFLMYFLKHIGPFMQAFATNTTISEFRPHRLKAMEIAVPSLNEQKNIIKKIKLHKPLIDEAIHILNEKKKWLEEKRSSLITQVVTKGLNQDVAMMDSEIEWLEQYPTHWMRSRIRKASSRVTDGAHVSPDESSREIPFVSIIDITNGIIDFENSLRTSAESFVQHRKHNSCPKPDDVLFSKDGTIGVTAVIKEEIDFVASSSLVIISPITDLVDSKYLDYWLRSNPIMEMVERVMSGSALRRISVRKVGDLPILLPPIQEQLEIVEYLERKITHIDKAINFIFLKINRLKEYQIALISAAVTGKIDVRGQA